jgi:magnesium-transporting ATPase (P-type)
MSGSTFEDDAVSIQAEDPLIFYIMGIGTFMIFMMIFILVFVWVSTYFCEIGPRIAVRTVYIVIMISTCLILYYAPREESYVSTGYEAKVREFHSFFVTDCASTLQRFCIAQ